MEKKIILCGAAVLIALQWLSLTKISGLENQIENYQSTVRNEMNHISNSLGNQTQTIDALLEKQASLLDSYDYTLGNYDTESKTLPLFITITPKEVKNGTTAALHYGEAPLPLKQEGAAFVGTLALDILDNIDHPKVVFSQGDTEKTETLPMYINVRQEVLPSIYPDFNGSSGYSYTNEVHSVDWEVSLPEKAGPTDIVFTDTRLEGFVDGEMVWEEEIESGRLQPFKKETPLAIGKTLEIYAVATDSLGFVHKALLEQHMAVPKGEPMPEPKAPHMEEWLYDKDGNLLSAPI